MNKTIKILLIVVLSLIALRLLIPVLAPVVLAGLLLLTAFVMEE